MERRFRTSVEIPLEDYIDLVLLIAEGEFKNIKDIIYKGLKTVLEQYDQEYLKQLREKYKDLVEKIEKSRSVVERSYLRKWRPIQS